MPRHMNTIFIEPVAAVWRKFYEETEPQPVYPFLKSLYGHPMYGFYLEKYYSKALFNVGFQCIV